MKSPRVFNQVEMNFIFITCLFTISLFSTCDAKSVSLCSESELAELQLMHSQCIKKEEERYKLLAESLISSEKNATRSASKTDSNKLLLCKMLHDFGEKCGQPLKKCLGEKEYR